MLTRFEPAHAEQLDLGDFDRRALGDRKVAPTGVAFTLMDGARVLGCGGLIPTGEAAEAWVLLSDELRARPMTLHRIVLKVLRIHDATWPVPIRAIARKNAAFACKWLARLGFKAVGESHGFVQYRRG